MIKRVVSIRTILPNMVTLSAFIMGLTAIRFSFEAQFEKAITALAIAAVLDGLDGTVARLLKSTSRFGAELDSLSDNVSFGVAPAIVMYLWALQPINKLGWAVASIYAVAMALRLARFNAQLDEDDTPHKRLGFFAGVPAPVGAGLMVLPAIITMAMEIDAIEAMPYIVAVNAVVVSLLMVSRLPTPSLKKIRFSRKFFPAVMLIIGIVIAGLVSKPWLVIGVILIVYLASLPICFVFFQKRLEQKGWAKE